MRNGVLVVGPFGLNEFEDDKISQVIEFNEFQQKNEDSSGWWHLSCSFSLNNQKFECILFNSMIEISRSLELKKETLIDRKIFY
jgi:hypothetical protein